MQPGYLHFDVRRGLRADLLNAAMAALLPNSTSVRDAFDSLDLGDISFEIGTHTHRTINGQLIQFYRAGRQIVPSSVVSEKCEVSIRSRRPLWHNENDVPEKIISAVADNVVPTNQFLAACLSNDEISLSDLRDVFFNQRAKPAIGALALKILQKLEVKAFSKQMLNSADALWLLCHLVMLCAQIDALDPKFITASKICISRRKEALVATKHLSLYDELWLNQVLLSVPTIEREEPIDSDVLGAAFITTLAGQFGVRGESSILQVGIGLSGMFGFSELSMVEALWCEASLPKSMSECGPNNHARLNFVHEITGAVSATTEMSHLAAAMSLHGAVSISWHLAHQEKNQSCYLVRFLCSYDDKREVIEAFLTKGGAYDVAVSTVEQHALNRRLVSVPIGTGNKASSARFCEYTYYDKTVRVEPLKEDLDNYVQRTNYSVDVARGDLLSAWKKWRGRIVAEDA